MGLGGKESLLSALGNVVAVRVAVATGATMEEPGRAVPAVQEAQGMPGPANTSETGAEHTMRSGHSRAVAVLLERSGSLDGFARSDFPRC